MKNVIMLSIAILLVSCHTTREFECQDDAHYVVFNVDSFDFYFNINMLAKFSHEMNDPNSKLFNKDFGKYKLGDINKLLSTSGNVEMRVDNLYTTFSDGIDNETGINAFYSVLNVQYLFFINKSVIIKSHYTNETLNKYSLEYIDGPNHTVVDIYNNQGQRIYWFYWEPWWGDIKKCKGIKKCRR